MSFVSVTFASRAEPLEPLAVVGTGPVAPKLVERVLALDDDALRALRGVSWSGGVVLLGPYAALPWVDGVFYLGRDPRAPRLLLPTHLTPNVPAAALERAILARPPHLGAVAPPVAVLAHPMALLSMDGSRVLSRKALGRWLGAHGAARSAS